MSCIQMPSDLGRIDLGYDALIDSYFVQVRQSDAAGNLQLREWLGSGVGDMACGGLIHDPKIVVRHASIYCRVPEGFTDALRMERLQGPEFIAVERVTYSGLPPREVWRQRGSSDPAYGTRINVHEHEIYTWSRQVASAILLDVLCHKMRVRQLAGNFACLFENRIRRPYWLLTESDIQSGIFEVEKANDLRWIPVMQCYAGKGRALDLSPEAQLRRAAGHDGPGSLLSGSQSISNGGAGSAIASVATPLSANPLGGDNE